MNGQAQPDVPGDLTLKTWGFWNTQGRRMGQPDDEGVRPWFYPWSLMTRLFTKDAQVYTSRESTPGIRVVAARSPSGLTVMLVNTTGEAKMIRVRVPGEGSRAVSVYRYFEDEHPTDGDSFPRPAASGQQVDLDSGAAFELPSRGVLFVTSEKAPGTGVKRRRAE